MNSTFTFALAAEHRADLLRQVAHERRTRTALVDEEAHGRGRAFRRRPR
ncbi:MAG TPA: hypothetical protein VGO19_00105 [Actinomycetes bacterium]